MKRKTSPRRKGQPPSERRKFPVATIAFYGPDDKTPTKIAVGIVEKEGEEPTALQRWASPDVAGDPQVHAEIKAFIQEHQAKSVVITEGVIGCPHEEGIDYPLGEDCPFCPFWKGKQ